MGSGATINDHDEAAISLAESEFHFAQADGAESGTCVGSILLFGITGVIATI